MNPESSQPPSDGKDHQDTQPLASDSLPVFLDDDALKSMEGKTVEPDAGADNDEGARLAVSQKAMKRSKGPSSGEGETRAGGAGRFSYFKALLMFLVAQLVVLVIIGTVFRRPLSQAYGRLVERGFVEPNVLPWQRGGAGSSADSSVGDVAWEDVRRRHEMTLLADAAIARADRKALDDLRGQLEIVDDPTQRAAARAEVFRVQQMYAAASRLPVDPLPVAQIFPGLTEESELSEEQIIKLLTDLDRETERRIRAAELLAGHRTLTATDALVLALRKDLDLDVVKQAMVSFKANTGYPGGDFFDAVSAENWWAQNAPRLAAEFQMSKEKTTPKKSIPAPELIPPVKKDAGNPTAPQRDPAAVKRQPAANEPAPAGAQPTPAPIKAKPDSLLPNLDAYKNAPDGKKIRPIE